MKEDQQPKKPTRRPRAAGNQDHGAPGHEQPKPFGKRESAPRERKPYDGQRGGSAGPRSGGSQGNFRGDAPPRGNSRFDGPRADGPRRESGGHREVDGNRAGMPHERPPFGGRGEGGPGRGRKPFAPRAFGSSNDGQERPRPFGRKPFGGTGNEGGGQRGPQREVDGNRAGMPHERQPFGGRGDGPGARRGRKPFGAPAGDKDQPFAPEQPQREVDGNRHGMPHERTPFERFGGRPGGPRERKPFGRKPFGGDAPRPQREVDGNRPDMPHERPPFGGRGAAPGRGKPFPKRDGNVGGRDFGPRGETPRGNFTPRGETPRGNFAPRGDAARGNFTPRGDAPRGNFTPRGETAPRSPRPAGRGDGPGKGAPKPPAKPSSKAPGQSAPRERKPTARRGGRDSAPPKREKTRPVSEPEPAREVLIDDLSHDGRGVAHVDGLAVFVPGALSGETCRIAIEERGKGFAVARLEEILAPSPERIAPACSTPQCGGCDLAHLSYQASLAYKRKVVVEALKRLGRFEDTDPETLVQPVIGMDDPTAYRNKAVFHVGYDDAGKPTLGFHKPGTWAVVDAGDCRILAAPIVAARALLAADLESGVLQPWEGSDGSGHLVQVLLRAGEGLLVCLVVAELGKAPKETLEKLTASGATSICEVLYEPEEDAILWASMRVLTGDGHVPIKVGGLSFRVSPASFFQVNTAQAERLFERATALAAAGPDDAVVDVYSGTGTLALFAARTARVAVGVDVEPFAVADAAANAVANEIKNARFVAGRGEKMVPQVIKEEKATIVFLDPPRAGCESRVLDAVAKSEAKRVVYVSCNPATLARDARRLAEAGFKLTRVEPVDLFPWTHHVETLTLLERA